MRILVFSDTHGVTDYCIRIINNIKHAGIDLILHAGDYTGDAEDLSYIFPEIPIEYVRGNNDFTRTPSDLVIDAENHKIFLTHGHGYRVKTEEDYRTLAEKAVSLGCDTAVFGHTHIPYLSTDRGITVLNPGSVRYSGTYAVIEIEGGKLKADIIKKS